MKVLVFIDIDFAKNAAHFMHTFHYKVPGSSFCVLQGTTPNATTDMLATLSSEVRVSEDIPDLNKLEQEWATSADENLLPTYENIIGPDKINRCIVAGKYLGDGYISGGGLPFSPLHKYCSSNEGKRRYLSGLFDFLFKYFVKEKPELVFLPSCDRSYLLGIFLVAQHFGIPVRLISTTKVESLYCIDSSARLLLPTIKKRFHQYLDNPQLGTEFISRATDYLHTYRNKPLRPPDDEKAMKVLFQKVSLKTIIILCIQILHPTYTPKGIQCGYPSSFLISYMKMRWRLYSEYSKFYWRRTADIVGKPFAYYPLQYEPEATTMIYAPFMTNQIAILEALSKAIPPSWVLAVKEHPSMMGRRPLSFYKRLRELPKVELIHPKECQFDLMKRASLISTITGTAGFEAMLLGKTPLFFGEVFCQAVGEGFVRCSDFEQLPGAVRKAAEGSALDEHRLILYLAALLKESFQFPIQLLQESWGDNMSAESQHEAWSIVIDHMLESLSDANLTVYS